MALTPGRIHGGGARVFVGGTVPASGAPPTMVAHTDGVPNVGAWTELGATQGDTIIRIRSVKKGIPAEQALGFVDVMTIEEGAEVEFTALEHVHIALLRALDQVGTVSDAAKDLYYFGGGTTILAPRLEPVVITSRQRNTPTKFIITCLYKAFWEPGFELPHRRTQESMFRMKAVAITDVTRTAGDQIGQHIYEK